jgi:type II secretion system protein D
MRLSVYGWTSAVALAGVACLGVAGDEPAKSRPRPERRPSGVQSAHPIASQFARQPQERLALAQEPQRPPARPTESQPAQPPVRPGSEMAQPPDSAEVPSFVGNVDIQALDQLGIVIIRGNPQDVESMRKLIEKIQEIAQGVEPFVRVFQLKRASATDVRDTINELYSGVSTPTGPGTSATGSQAAAAATRSTQGLTTSALKQFQIAADERTNTLLVQTSPPMMEELAKLIARLDVDSAPTVNEVRVFHLKNAEPQEVADVLNEAVGSSTGTTSTGGNLAQLGSAAAAGGAGGDSTLAGRTAVLKFVPMDDQGKAVQSGILDEVRVTPQVRTNSLVVSAPASAMDLLAAIIAELDKPPQIVAAVKVFQLKNSDANSMRLTLGELFDLESTTTTGVGGAGGLGAAGGLQNAQFQRPIAAAAGDQPPVSLRVAVDSRTNSLIVTGPENSLLSVEAVIRKLDLSDIHNRKSTVYRLKNARALDVAQALTDFFTNKRTIESQQVATGTQQQLVGAYQRLEQDVVVVALDNALAASLTTANVTTPPSVTTDNQGVSNMLLISASPRNYDQVIEMIEELDAPQPQVLIQVVIANLTLTDDFEFGLEFGLQDGLMFDRGGTNTDGTTGLATLVPGFNFNTSPVPGVPNSVAARPDNVAGQGLTNFSLGRVGIDGLGGLVLTASSGNVSALLRTLQANGQLQIISRPQIMTLDGRTARVLVGERFPYVGAVQPGTTAVTATVSFQDIGVVLTVKPSITPDDRIYMEVVPEISELKETIVVNQIVTTTGTVAQEAPRTTTTSANTVVSVGDGQTIILGGLIQKRRNEFVRKIPWLGDLPHVGFLFRYTQDRELRQELLIVMTPHIIRTDSDAQRLKELEVARTNWILEASADLHGDLGVGGSESMPAPQAELIPNEQGRVDPSQGYVPQSEGVEQTEHLVPVQPARTAAASRPIAKSSATKTQEPPKPQPTTPAPRRAVGERVRGLWNRTVGPRTRSD